MTTFWSMQLHPNNIWEFPPERIKRILSERRMVGVGGDNGDAKRFQYVAKKGDIVLIRRGGTLIALVELTSDAYPNPRPDSDCWFDVVRDIKIIAENPERHYVAYKMAYGHEATSGLRDRGAFAGIRNQNITNFLQYWLERTNGGEMTNETMTLLKRTKQIVLTGAPGTGKTFLARQLAINLILGRIGISEEALTSGEKEKIEDQIGFCQFHPSMDYTDFVEGLRPVRSESEDEEIGFERRDGIFKAFCRKAIRGAMRHKHQDNFEEAWNRLLSKIEETDGEMLRIPLQGDKSLDIELNTRGTGLVSRVYGADGNWIQGRSKFFTKEQVYRVYRNLKGVPSGGHDNYRRRIISFMKVNCGLVEYQKGALEEGNRQMPPYVFIIDEINRGDISKIFGELFFAIDPDYRGTKGRIKTQYDNLIEDDVEFEKGFYVPENVFIIGTMNDIDRSVESMDFAIRRRFSWREVTPEDTQDAILTSGIQDVSLRERARNRMDNLNRVIRKDEELGPAFQIGAAYFKKVAGHDFVHLWEYHLKSLLMEYMRGQDGVKTRLNRFYKAYGDETVHGDSEDE